MERRAGAALGYRRERLEHVRAWRGLRALERTAAELYDTALSGRERVEAAGLLLRIGVRKEICGNPRRA